MTHAFSKLKGNMAMMWDYRELLWNLAHREINQRYKQSALGYAWVILTPLIQMLVLTFVFSVILKVSAPGGTPFILFLSVALLPWNFFVASISSSANALVSNSNLITKIYFPREILVYATIIAKLVDLLYSLLVLLFFFIIFRTPLQITLIYVPFIFLIQIIFTAGLSLIVASFNLFYRDIQYFMALLLTLWLYITPIMYPVEVIPDRYRFVFSLNPMAVITNAYRKTILSGGPPNWNSLAIALIMAVVVFIFGFYVFKKSEGKFADYV